MDTGRRGAWLSPLLAFNLGLDIWLEPFLSAAEKNGQQPERKAPSLSPTAGGHGDGSGSESASASSRITLEPFEADVKFGHISGHWQAGEKMRCGAASSIRICKVGW